MLEVTLLTPSTWAGSGWDIGAPWTGLGTEGWTGAGSGFGDGDGAGIGAGAESEGAESDGGAGGGTKPPSREHPFWAYTQPIKRLAMSAL